jgi:hypothetical protein
MGIMILLNERFVWTLEWAFSLNNRHLGFVARRGVNTPPLASRLAGSTM